jgi:S-DNA-T family DNA segregation ATPase FtsK/SpoIIIE
MNRAAAGVLGARGPPPGALGPFARRHQCARAALPRPAGAAAARPAAAARRRAGGGAAAAAAAAAAASPRCAAASPPRRRGGPGPTRAHSGAGYGPYSPPPQETAGDWPYAPPGAQSAPYAGAPSPGPGAYGTPLGQQAYPIDFPQQQQQPPPPHRDRVTPGGVLLCAAAALAAALAAVHLATAHPGALAAAGERVAWARHLPAALSAQLAHALAELSQLHLPGAGLPAALAAGAAAAAGALGGAAAAAAGWHGAGAAAAGALAAWWLRGLDLRRRVQQARCAWG